jgi:hypothetical protein
MTVPFGFIWEGVKAEALNVIVEGVEPDLKKALTFYSWRDKGGYLVKGATKKDFLVSCATKEFSGVIAREVSTLLDQALEHRLVIAATLQQAKTPSRSWLLVTTYYWCVFLALAWLRLVGNVVTFLPSKEVERLKQLGHNIAKAPTTGTYVISVSDNHGARSDLIYRRLKSNNFHDGLWDTFYSDINSRLLTNSAETLSAEFRMFLAIAEINKFDKSSWLSKLRNAVNYRVGFAYGSVEGHIMPEMVKTVAVIKSKNANDLTRELENAQLQTAGRSALERPDEYSRVMLLFGALMTHVLENYCKEVWNLRNIDPKWVERRDKYARGFTDAIDNKIWPM